MFYTYNALFLQWQRWSRFSLGSHRCFIGCSGNLRHLFLNRQDVLLLSLFVFFFLVSSHCFFLLLFFLALVIIDRSLCLASPLYFFVALSLSLPLILPACPCFSLSLSLSLVLLLFSSKYIFLFYFFCIFFFSLFVLSCQESRQLLGEPSGTLKSYQESPGALIRA